MPFDWCPAQLALQPGRVYGLLGLLALVFGLAMARVYRGIHANVVGALRARTENEALLARVAQSESQLRDAIESYPEGIAIFDAGGRLVVCNENYARLYGSGRSAAALKDAPYAEILRNACEVERPPREFRERPGQWLEARLAERHGEAGAPRLFETADGRYLQGLFARSRGVGFVSVFTDVTELRRAQDAYGRLLEEEGVMLDTLPVGVAFLAERVILRCNRRLEQMLGYGAGELTGQPARVLYPTEEAWQAAGRGYERVRRGEVLSGELELARKDGGRLWCSLLTRALDPAGGNPTAIVAFSDVSERHAAGEALREREAMYRNLVETSSELIWSLDGAGRWTYLNPAAVRRIYGCEPGDMLGRDFRESLVNEVRERDVVLFRRILEGETVFDFETRHRRRDGTTVDLAFNAVPLRDAQGEIVGATGTARDVSAEKAAAAAMHESVERLRLAVDAASLVYWEWQRDAGELHWGRDPSALVGAGDGGRSMRWADYVQRVHPEDRERYAAAVESAWEQVGRCSNDYRVVRADGSVVWLSSHGRTLADASGVPRRMIGVTQDITERKRHEEEARFLAYHDTLTGLPNRRLLDDRLRQAVFLAQRRDARVAVLAMDLDRFKQVNDELGHRAGDAVLREAAHRIGGCVRKADTLARQGGDEFVVLIPDLRAEADCEVVAGKILRALAVPFKVEGREFSIGASIGVSVFPADAGDGETLLRNADVAMYRAKQQGRNAYRFYGR